MTASQLGVNVKARSCNQISVSVDADDQVRTVDSGSHYCPMRLYLCDLITSWSLESYGLQALAEVSDLLRMQIDRFDQEGRKAFRSYNGPHQCFYPTSRTPPWTLTGSPMKWLQFLSIWVRNHMLVTIKRLYGWSQMVHSMMLSLPSFRPPCLKRHWGTAACFG